MMNESDPNIEISLPKDEALILFDWLSRFNEGSSNYADDVEKQILADLEAFFEKIFAETFADNYHEIIDFAKARIRSRSL